MTTPFDPNLWKTRLREAGLRVTVTRLAVLRTLHESPTPLSAQEVFERLDSQGADRVTIYRTLASLEEVKLLHRVDPGDRVWRYGLLQKSHHEHAHFVCDDCGEIRCLDDAAVTISFSSAAKRAGEKIRVKQHDVYLHGVCEKCEETGKPAGTAKTAKAMAARRATKAKPRRKG
ncbi:MAG TPA: Fur family transcriptional regulator [Phycisphaerales bacterium]|nr:Fur family transcriptional regulator [Phycisphaerales bacterium]